MRYNTTLILAAVAIAAAALIYVYRDQLTGTAKPPEKPTEALALLKDVKTDSVESATLEEPAGEGKFQTKAAFKKTDGKWRLTSPVEWEADEYEVGRLLRAAVEGKTRQTIEPAKRNESFDTYGLASPAYRLVLTAAAKDKQPARTYTVAVGRRASIGENLYVRLDDEPKVTVLERSDLLDRAREKVETYRGRDVLHVQRDEVVRIDLEGEKGKVHLDRAEKDGDRWVMAQPMAARVDPDASSALLRAALGLNAKAFPDDSPKDLAPYGLDKPRLTVTLYKKAPPPEKPKEEGKKEEAKKDEAKKEEKKEEQGAEPVKVAALRFGAWADIKHEQVYLLTDDGKHVVAVDASGWKDMDKGATDLRDKHVLAVDTAKAAKVTLRLPAKLTDKGAEVKYELAKDASTWKVKAEGRPDAKADPSAVEALLKELADLKVLYFAEGERAELAKGFKALGSVRLQIENEPSEQGLDFGGPAGAPAASADGSPSLVKNLREDWIGRINEKALTALRKDWLDALDKEVFTVDPKKVTGATLSTTDRKIVLTKKDDKWKMTAPIEADPTYGFGSDLLRDLQPLKADRFVAATKDFKAYGLDKPEVTFTVTLAAEKEGGPAASGGRPPAEKVLRLSHRESKIVARADNGDLVFEVPASLFTTLTAEPIDKSLTQVTGDDINRLDLAAAAVKVTLVKVDNKWYRADDKGTPGDEVQADAVRDITSAVGTLSAVRWAAYDAKAPAKFGLDKPALRLTMKTDKAATTLLLSAKEIPAGVASIIDQKPARYAMTEGGQRIAILAGKSVETLLGAAKAFEPKKEEPKKEEPKKDEAKKEKGTPPEKK
jgi:hypothetical protein